MQQLFFKIGSRTVIFIMTKCADFGHTIHKESHTDDLLDH